MTTTFPLSMCCHMLGITPKTCGAGCRRPVLSLQSRILIAATNAFRSIRYINWHSCIAASSRHSLASGSRHKARSRHPRGMKSPFLSNLLWIRRQHKEEQHRSQKNKNEEILIQLEMRLATILEQITQLVFSLVREQNQHHERRIAALEALVQPSSLDHSSLQENQETSLYKQDREQKPWPSPHPAEKRRRPVLPLIQYEANNIYRVVCPKEGRLPLIPDSPEWFTWLASLSSFRFVGQAGRFSACREYDHGPKRTWRAYRYIHRNGYRHCLGATEHLTIACLEQMAARLQS